MRKNIMITAMAAMASMVSACTTVAPISMNQKTGRRRDELPKYVQQEKIRKAEEKRERKRKKNGTTHT